MSTILLALDRLIRVFNCVCVCVIVLFKLIDTYVDFDFMSIDCNGCFLLRDCVKTGKRNLLS